MHRSIIILALFLFSVAQSSFAAAQFSRLFGSGPPIKKIETAELHQLLTTQQKAEAEAKAADEQPPQPNFVLVDVRSDAEIKVSVIPAAITKAEYEKNAKKYVGKTVIPYCLSGGRSSAYAKQLARQGVKVKNYQDSILGWLGHELPLATLDGEPTNRVNTLSNRHPVPAKYEQINP